MNVDVAVDCHSSEADTAHSEWWRGFLKGDHLWDDPSKEPLSVVDLFCGSGGFGLGTALAAGCFDRRAVFHAIADADTSAMEVYGRYLPVRKKIADSLATIVDYSVDQMGDTAEFDYPPPRSFSMTSQRRWARRICLSRGRHARGIRTLTIIRVGMIPGTIYSSRQRRSRSP